MRCVLALLVAGLAGAVASSVNYCGAKMCGHSNAHTFCQYHPGPGPNCVGYMDARLTAEEKVRVLARLNQRRSDAASGRLRNMPTAGNMLKLRWVEELAREAQRWADQCRPPRTPDERDACRDLFSISVGQCVASVVGEAPGLRVETMVDLWYMQSMLYKENITSYVVPMSSVNYYGDFAQMIWARSYMVGCGRSRFMSEWHGRLRTVERLVCNVSPRGPGPGRPLWSPAPPTAACPPRSVQDPQLPALCNFHADLDVTTDIDAAMTIEEHVLLSTVLEIESRESLNYLGSLDELYLTKLAIVTMENTVTQALSFYNPIHKRDIIDTLGLNYNTNNVNNNIIDIEAMKNINATLETVYERRPTPQIVFKKIKIMGRPKSYNFDELTDIGGEQTTSNQINLPETRDEKFLKIDPDVYLDGDALDPEEDNVTSTANISSLPSEDTPQNQLKVISSTEYNEVKINYTDEPAVHNLENGHIASDTTEVFDVTLTVDNSSKYEDVNSTLLTSSKTGDDYLTDPETVGEIQEALERMERSLEVAPQATGKVRRDLREPPPNNNHENDKVDPNNIQDFSVDTNKHPDRGPMLNMVLKYIPYLKPYEKDILRSTASGSSMVKSTNSLFSVNVALICFRL